MARNTFELKDQAPIYRDEAMSFFASQIGRKKYDPIRNIQEQNNLITLAQAGEVSAAHEIIERNLRFAFKFSKNFTGSNLKQSDALAAAVIGMCEAVTRFDTTKGFKFYSYAKAWMFKKCIEAVNESLLIAIPSGVRQNNKKVERFELPTDCTPRQQKKYYKQLLDKHKSEVINHAYTEVKNDDGKTIPILDTIPSDEEFKKYGESNESELLKIQLTSLLTYQEYTAICQNFGLFGTPERSLDEPQKRALKRGLEKLKANKNLLKYFLR